MNDSTTLCLVIDFVFIGLLPKIFFKKDGHFNKMWWLTAAPFVLSLATILLVHFHLLPRHMLPFFAFHIPGTARKIMDLAATVLSLSSICLISFTLGTHRIPIALWHQSNDAPQEIVTWGAYKYIRHPFYASFLLAFLAAFVYLPGASTLIAFIWGIAILNFTAAKEEDKLVNSQLGPQYQAYMQSTGRFLPPLVQKHE